MKKVELNLQKFQTNKFDLTQTTEKIKLSEVFRLNNATEICHSKLFVAHFNKIPNYLCEIDINCKKAHIWFVENYEKDIADVYYNKRYFRNNKNAEYEDIFYFLFEDLIVNFDMNQSIIRLLFRRTAISKIDSIVSELKKFKKRKKTKPQISLLVHTRAGIEITSLKIPKPTLEISDNYNDDFIPVHDIILKRLSKKNNKGLVLLHGKPGTGKTSYIRYLITRLKKNVIFLPPSMATALTNPELIPTLIDNPNSIFVIEDAENIILEREHGSNSAVSALLNISDGLLSDCLNIQIICSFNTDVSKIDSALLRKGRLIARYDFQDLNIEKANILSKKLGFETEFKASMPLSMIYNQDEKNIHQPRRLTSIGFQTRNAG